MKTYLKIYFLTSAMFMLMTFQSCEKDDSLTDQVVEGVDSTNFELTTEEVELSKEEVLALEKQGIFLETNFATKIHRVEEGIEENGILVDDIFVPYEQLNSWMNDDIDNSRLWITQDRVSFPSNGRRNLTFGIVVGGASSALNGTQRNAAITAVQRYNALNMNKIRYSSIVQGSNVDFILGRLNADTFIRIGFTGNFEAMAQFPFFGDPGRIITLNQNTANYDQNRLTVLIQHEIGHSLGLRHSDFATRRSCTNGSGESSSGSEPIPGTNSSGNSIISIMRACDASTTNSNFRTDDINSLRNAYSGISF